MAAIASTSTNVGNTPRATVDAIGGPPASIQTAQEYANVQMVGNQNLSTPPTKCAEISMNARQTTEAAVLWPLATIPSDPAFAIAGAKFRLVSHPCYLQAFFLR